MKIKSHFLDDMILNSKIMMLVRHLEYSLRDVKSYEDLTSDEKSIISKEVFMEYFQEGSDSLISDKVKFHPWVGEKYHCGVKGFSDEGEILYGTVEDPGLKILVLGDYHCFSDPLDVTSTATQDRIKDLIDPHSMWEPYKNTYTGFIKSFTGYLDELRFEDKKEAWDHLAFYKYVQNPIIKILTPRDVDYKISELAFRRVLDELKPDLIIVWGDVLYNKLPEGGKQLDDLETLYFDPEFAEYEEVSIEIWSYNVDKKDVPILHITHPVHVCYIESNYNIIKSFINKYKTKETWTD